MEKIINGGDLNGYVGKGNQGEWGGEGGGIDSLK